MNALIYHGTPLTPRAALQSIMPGRAACVSFYRPDDLEALLAICPQFMFRSWRVLILDGGDACWEGMGRGRARGMVASLLPMVGADHLASRALGDYAGHPCGPIAVERWSAERLALRSFARRAGLAHGRIDRSACPTVRAIPARLRRMDRRSEEGAGRLSSLSPQDGRGYSPDGQCMAPTAHASGNGSGLRLSLYQRRQHQPRAERVEIRQPHGHNLRGQMARTMCLCRPVGRETR